MAATERGESTSLPSCRPSDSSMDTKTHRSSMVEVSIPAAFAMAGGSLHHPAGGSSRRSAPVSRSGM